MKIVQLSGNSIELLKIFQFPWQKPTFQLTLRAAAKHCVLDSVCPLKAKFWLELKMEKERRKKYKKLRNFAVPLVCKTF